MSRLFESGLEEGNIAAPAWSSSVGSLSTTNPYTGTYCFDNATQGNQDYVRRNFVAGATSGTHYTHFRYRLGANPSATRQILRVRNAAGSAVNFRLTVTSGGVLTLTNDVTTTTRSGPTLTVGEYARIEIRHLISDTVGQIEVRVDGANAFGIGNFTGGNGTDEDTLATDVGQYSFGGEGEAGGGPAGKFDDIIINDATGSAPFNTWVGDSRISILVPNTEVSVQFTPSTGTDNSANVDDLPGAPDDDTTYNSSSTSGQIDRLGLTDLPAEVPSDADIISLDVWARIRGEGTTSSRSCRVKLWDEGGNLTDGPTCNDNDGTTYQVMDVTEHLVFDASTRTKANIADFNAGYEPTTNHPTRVTTLWVNVEWRPVQGQLTPTTAPLTLTGVAPRMDLGIRPPTMAREI